MYEKQTWTNVYGETPFTADRMNHIEEGIANGVVESGSNENGSWVKFNDGTLICRMRKTIRALNKGEFYGETPLFPSKFINKANCNINISQSSNNGGWALIMHNAFPTSDGASYYLNFYNADTNYATATSDWDIIAIGRWK